MATIVDMKDRIEETLRDLVLADAPLAAIAVVMRGYDPRSGSRIDFFPLVEVFTERRERVSEETGLNTYRYTVHLGVSVLIADATNPDDADPRKADVASYLETGRYVAALKNLLLKHESLNGVSFTDPDGFTETAWYLEVGEDYAGVEQRQNNWTNFGRITFTVHTRQLRG